MSSDLPPLVIPERFNMARYCLAAQAERLPDKLALVVVADAKPGTPPLETWTFAELEDAVLRVAAALEDRGLKPGDRILIRLDNTSTYPLLYFGAIAAGVIAVATSSQLTAAEAEFLVEDSAPRAVALAPNLPRGAMPAGVAVLEEAEVRAMIRYPRRAD
jgi:acyl-CoA synthetase (AMP-forming)/AMP-acid ligase II